MMNGEKHEGCTDSIMPHMFGEEMRQTHFSFAEDYKPLNHGSFGTIPKTVLAYQQWLQLQTESQPDTFIRYTYLQLLKEARAAVAPLLGADTDEVVFVPNATTGINTILRNLEYNEGDIVLCFNTIYGACLKTIQSLGETTPVRPHVIEISYPIEDDEILHRFKQTVQDLRKEGKTVKLAMFDAVLTFPGVRFPWERLVEACRGFRIFSFVDAAHGIGHINLTQLGTAGPDFVISNCYKWLMAPRGCAVLYVPFRNQHYIRTTFPTSWGYGVPSERAVMNPSEYFVRLFQKVSTTDNTPYLCVPAAIKFRRDVCGGEAAIRQYCEKVAREGGARMAQILGTEVLSNKSGTLQECCFVNVRLPLQLSELSVEPAEGPRIAKWMQEKTPEEYKTYIPTKFYAGAFWSRISGQVYLTVDDFVWAARVLRELCDRARGGEFNS